MKKTWMTTVAVSAVAMLALAGCSSASPDASPSASVNASSAALESIKWSEDDKGVPTLTFDQPFNVTSSEARLVADGDGDALASGQVISLSYTITDGKDGSVVYSTYDSNSPESITLTQDAIDPVLWNVLSTAHVGANFIYAVPDTSTQPAGTALMAVTVSSALTPLDRAKGTAVAPVDGLPTVTLADNGAPTITVPQTDPPADLVAQDLITGDGPVVKDGQTVTVHYTGVLWADGTQFDSSWDRGTPSSFTLTQGQLIDGWVKGLVGKTVGSQVLLVIPPSLGYGDKGTDTIPGGATLVFVVDILAAS